MFLDEIFRPKTGDEVLMSAEDMRQARINRYGTDDITPVTAQDYSDKFNTELTPEEEAEFQSWAKENNRERDSYDYDIRGAWKELKSGSMSEDERGHLGDKYKKPNHPTFSDQSVYNGKDGVAGGTWSEVDGKTVFTPGRMLSRREAEYLSDYFTSVEPDVKLNLDGKIIKPKPLPGTGYEPGWFEGFGDTWLGINAALAETKSAALTALSELPIGTEQEREGWLRAAEATRAYSKAHYEADPELMGAASQIIHGLFKTIPKAAGYMAALGSGGGAVAFGADMGISESQRLKNEGVDQKTRTSAGVMSFAANAIGLRLPGAFGSTRLMSTLYGAGANIGTDVAERKGIQLILENQNYGELAKQYEISGTELAVSGIFGGAFGALGYRSPQAKFESEVAERREFLKKELMKAGRSEEQADVEAGMTAPGEVLFAKQAGVDWKDVDYTIEKTDSTQATDGFHMPVTQGIEWHMGPRGLSPDEKMRVVSVTPTVIDKGEAINIVTSAFKDGIHNEDTGFTLRMSKSDAKKSAGKDGGSKRKAFMAVAENIREIAESAKLVESHVDIVHKNPKVRGIHVFLAPMSWNGELWRVQLLVKDTVEEGPARAVTHSIDGVYVEKMETPPGGSFQSEGGVSYVEGSPAVINRRDVRTGQVAQDRTVSVSQLMGGSQPFVRKDGRAFFDPVDESARQINGAYYEAPSVGARRSDAFNQAAYHGTAYTFDKFTLDHVGSGEGVQAHGWGLYFSLDRQIAEGYRSRVTSYRAVADELSRVFAGMDVKTREGMAKALSSAGDKLSPATRELLDALQEANWLGHENPMDAVQAALVAQIGKGRQTPRIKSAVEGLRNEEGNVYKVEIPDDDVMMHEDLPLSKRPEAVQKAVHALLTDEDVRTQPNMRREKNGIEDVEPVSYAGKSLDEMTGKEILAALIAK